MILENPAVNQHKIGSYSEPRRNILLPAIGREKHRGLVRVHAQHQDLTVPAPEQISAEIHPGFQFFKTREVCYFVCRSFFLSEKNVYC